MNVNKALFKFIKIAFTILIIVFAIYVTVEVSKIGYEFGYRAFTEPAMEKEPGHDIRVQIDEGMSDVGISTLLEEKGLIRSDKLFYAQLKLYGYSGDLKSGVYTLNTSMEPKELMIALSQEADTESEESVEDVTESSAEDVTTTGVEEDQNPENEEQPAEE